MRHFQDDEKFHWHELIKQQVEREERLGCLRCGIWGALENVLTAIVVFLDKLAVQEGVDACNDEDEGYIDCHERVDAFVEA